MRITGERKPAASNYNGGCAQVGHAQPDVWGERKAEASMANGGCGNVGYALPADDGVLARYGAGYTHFITFRDDTGEGAASPLNHEAAVVMVPVPAWRTFIDAVKAGEFDVDEHGYLPERSPAAASQREAAGV